MTKKKKIIYSMLVVVFLFTCLIYFVIASGTNTKVFQKRLVDDIKITKQHIEENIQFQIKNSVYEFHNSYTQKDGSLEEILKAVNAANVKLKDMNLYLYDGGGVVYQGEGAVDQKIDDVIVTKAKDKGYALFQSVNYKTNETSVSTLIPIISGDEIYYILQEQSMEQFINCISKGFTVPSDTVLIFNKSRNIISDIDLQDLSQKNRQEIMDEAVAFNEKQGYTTHKSGFKQIYNVYIEFEEPADCLLYLRADYTNSDTLFSITLPALLVTFLVWFILIIIIITLDIMNDRDNKKEIQAVGAVDQLTGLVNRAGIEKLVEQFVHSHPNIGEYSYVCIDIAAFSRINQMFGYTMGDQLLKTISTVIKTEFYCGARLNADCFSFISKYKKNIIDDIEDLLCQQIKNEIGEEYNQMISFKFGLCVIENQQAAFSKIHENALIALKSAKNSTRKEVFYDKDLQNSMDMKKNIEMNMIHALSKEEFLVYVHPQFDTQTEQCCRGEVLVRWQSEFMGFLPPDKFIPLFEANGFIVEIDFFMLSKTLEFLQDRKKQGKQLITLAVNQSRVTICFPNYYERLQNLVAQYDVPLHYIELEVTESTLENDMEVIVPLLHNVKKMGFNIALDDFGSGFSSLNTLRLLPIDVLKIDRAFLQESDTSQRSKIIIRNVVNLAKEISIQVVCEGVETKEQIEFLRSTGCDLVQGFYYTRPIPIESFIDTYLQNSK